MYNARNWVIYLIDNVFIVVSLYSYIPIYLAPPRLLYSTHEWPCLDLFPSYSCATNSETKEEVAIKRIGNAFDNRIDAKRTLREIKLLCHLDHENVSPSKQNA